MKRRGVSVFISAVLFIAITLTAITIVLNVGLPQLRSMEDTAAIENSIKTLNRLDTAIQDVAAGGRYSKREVSINFDRGEYGFEPASNELYYELETDSPMIATHNARPVGPVQLQANTDVSVTNTTVDGTDCYRMTNQRLETCIRQINATNAGTVNTSQMLVRMHTMATGTDLNGQLYVQINGTKTTRNNVTKTFVAETGAALSRGRVTAQVNTTDRGRYNVTYELLSGADFLTVRADADRVTAGLRFAIGSPSTDRVYIDGQQRGAGVYDATAVDFGYGIGQNGALFGGVVAGNGFTRVGYDDTVGGGRYELNATNSGDSIFLIPFTSGSVGDVEDREPSIRDGVIGRFFNHPAPNFGYELGQQKTVRAALSYDNLEITGIEGTLSPGIHQLLIANNGVAGGKANISITVK